MSAGVVVMSLRGCSLLQEAADDMGPWGYILGTAPFRWRDARPSAFELTAWRSQALLWSTTFRVWLSCALLPARWRTEPPPRRPCSYCRCRNHPHPPEDPNWTWRACGEGPRSGLARFAWGDRLRREPDCFVCTRWSTTLGVGLFLPCGPQLDADTVSALPQRCMGVACPEKRLCFLRLPLPLRSRCFGVEGDRECN